MYKNILLLIFFFYGCQEIINPIIPSEYPDDSEDIYSINLHSLDAGDFFNQITINWNQYNENNFISYSILNELDEIIETENNYLITSLPIKTF